MTSSVAPPDRFAVVDGLRLRYIEAGAGAPVLLLHGGSLGSSADVFLGNLPPLAAAGLRVIAWDQPGFGLSDVPADHSTALRRRSITGLMDALGLERAALIAHSQAGNMAARLALTQPERITHLVVLSTGSLLPPAVGPTRKQPATPREWQAGPREPTLADTRRALEETVYRTALITDAAVALRHSRSVGRNFEAFLARQTDVDGDASPARPDEKPLWQRLPELTIPLLMIYGRNDRAQAAERAELLKRMHPALDLHIVDRCKHLLPWDAADDLVRLAVPFLRRSPG